MHLSEPVQSSSLFNLQALLAKVSDTFSGAQQHETSMPELAESEAWSVHDLYGDSSW